MRKALFLAAGIVLILGGASVAIMGISAAYLLPPKFAAAARIRIPGTTTPAALATQLEAISSQSILLQVATNLNLAKRWGEKFKEGELPPPLVSALLKRDLTVRLSGKTQIIDIRFVSDSPDEAAEIANELVEAYRASSFSDKNANGAPAIQVLEKAWANPRPVSPNKPLTMAVGCGVGALIGLIGAVFLMAFMKGPKPAPAR